MDETDTLIFSNFLRYYLNSNKIIRNNTISTVIKAYFDLKKENEKFIRNPKKIERTIPDFKKMIQSDYDPDSNPGKPIKTNLPLRFIENENSLKVLVRDNTNSSDVLEIKILFDIENLNINEVSNIEKELLLYSVSNIKKGRNSLESITSESKKDLEIEKLSDKWENLKIQIDNYTQRYKTFLEKFSSRKEKKDKFFNKIIQKNNMEHLRYFENNFLITSLTHGEQTKNKMIKYYIVINIIINKYKRCLALLENKVVDETKWLGSVVYKVSSEISLNNIFIVTGKTDNATIDILSLEGKTTLQEPIDNYNFIYNQLDNISKNINDLYFQIVIEDVDISVEKITKKKIPNKMKAPVYNEKKINNRQKYKDLELSHKKNNIIRQEIITPPKYKEIDTLRCLDKFISPNKSKFVFADSRMSNVKIGDGVINATKQGKMVKEHCEDCELLIDKFINWRNILTKTHIEIHKSNGKILPIVIDKKTFSSVNHYMKYYMTLDNYEIAKEYLYEGNKGKEKQYFDIPPTNEDWLKTNNTLFIPNYAFRLVKATAAKFIQNAIFKNILLGLENISIIGKIDFYAETKTGFKPNKGEYEVLKELIFVQKYILENSIDTFYENYLDDLEISKKINKRIKKDTVPQFITIKADKIIKKQLDELQISDVISDDDSETAITYSKTVVSLVRKKIEIKKLLTYVNDVLNKEIYNVPGDGNCLFNSVVSAIFAKNLFDSLDSSLKNIFKGSFSSELLDVKVNNRLVKKPILIKTSNKLRKLVSNILKVNYTNYIDFLKQYTTVPDSLNITIISDFSNIIDQKASAQDRIKLKFMESLLLEIYTSQIYTDFQNYISAISQDARDDVIFEKGWGGNHELVIISCLFCININLYPSNSVEIEDLENYYFIKYRESIEKCIIPDEINVANTLMGEIDIGFLIYYPQHYVAIVTPEDNIENRLVDILEEEELVVSSKSSNLDTLISTGIDIDLARTSLELNRNNLKQAMSYIDQKALFLLQLLEKQEFFNVEFQTNNLKVKMGGSVSYISQFHEGSENSYFGNYDFLESAHNFIQWLFPNPHISPNNTDLRCVLKNVERNILKTDSIAKDNLFLSLRTMMDFYGANLTKNADSGTALQYNIEKNSNIEERLNNFNTKTHNFARITRILKYLGIMEEYELQYMVLDYFINSVFVEYKKISWSSSIMDSFNYWTDTILDKRERDTRKEIIEIYKTERRRRGMGVQIGGSRKPLENNYFQFRYSHKNKKHNIVYAINQNQKTKNAKIIGILNKRNQIIYEKDMAKNSEFKKILNKVHKNIRKKKKITRKKSIKQIPYMREGNGVYLNNCYMGTYKNNEIIFN